MRPDLLALARQIDAQELTTGSIKGSYAPSLNASAGLSESGPALDSMNWGFRGLLSLNWQLFAIEATHEAAVNARVRLNLAEGRYQAGVGNVIELGDSQVALTTAAGQEVQAVFNLATARARLLQALGQP